MTRAIGFIRRHEVAAYVALVFALSWGSMMLIAGARAFPLPYEQFERLGPALYVAMLSGPCVASLLLTLLVDGRAGARDLVRRLLRWRVGSTWYARALAPVAAMAAMPFLMAQLSADFRPLILDASDRTGILMRAAVLGLVFGAFEEIGWSGFAVPHIRMRHSITATGLLVGTVWGAWHFPLFWEADSFSRSLPFAVLVARLFSWLPPFRVLMVEVYDHTKSLPVVIVMHAALVVDQLALRPAALTGGRLLLHLIVFAGTVWLVLLGTRAASALHAFRHPVRPAGA